MSIKVFGIDKTKSELTETDMIAHKRKQALGARAFPSTVLFCFFLCLSFYKWPVHNIEGFIGPTY